MIAKGFFGTPFGRENPSKPSTKARSIPAPLWREYRTTKPKPASRRDQIRAGLRTRKSKAWAPPLQAA